MTKTAFELMQSPEFWIKRIEEQLQYIIDFDGRWEVKESAIDVLEMCEETYIRIVSEKEVFKAKNRDKPLAELFQSIEKTISEIKRKYNY